MLKNTFVRYFIIGLSGAFLDFAVYSFLYGVFSVNVLVANIIAGFVGFNNNFFLNAFFNFKTKENLITRYFSYFGVCVFGMVISSTFIYVTFSIMGFNAFLSKFLAMTLIFIVQYFLNKKITFRKIG